jgi:hypothetical protein
VKARYEVVDAKPEHIEPIAERIRQADIDELWAAAAMLPRDALRFSLAGTTISGTWLVDEEPAAIGGIADYQGGSGVVWLITTDLVEKHTRGFLEESRRAFARVKPHYDCLFNYVDQRNRRAIRWLQWLGFKMSDPVIYGVFRRPFLPFSWRAE